MRIRRLISEPIRPFISMNHRWRGPDCGLIWCWERGRQMRIEKPEFAIRAERGELLPLNWKGGVTDEFKGKKKQGSLQYLAQWMGLRGQDLDIDTDAEIRIVCTRTGVEVLFSGTFSNGE